MERKKEIDNVIKFENLGIVSVEMDPKNPQTKFDEKLKALVPAGKIYQIAFFNKDNKKFKLIDNIASGKNYTYDITKDTDYEKFNKIIKEHGPNVYSKYMIRSICETYGRICVVTSKIKSNKREDQIVLDSLAEVPYNEDTFSLNYLKENNDRFVKKQMKFLKTQLKEVKKSKPIRNCEILSPEF